MMMNIIDARAPIRCVDVDASLQLHLSVLNHGNGTSEAPNSIDSSFRVRDAIGVIVDGGYEMDVIRQGLNSKSKLYSF